MGPQGAPGPPGPPGPPGSVATVDGEGNVIPSMGQVSSQRAAHSHKQNLDKNCLLMQLLTVQL